MARDQASSTRHRSPYAQEIEAIDVHGHFGVATGHSCSRVDQFMSAGAAEVVRRAQRVGIVLTVVSPLAGLVPHPRGAAAAANLSAARVVARHPGLRQWVVVNPQDGCTYDQAARLLESDRCVGIKIHPELHKYPIRRFGKAIFEFAEEHRAVVTTHSGQKWTMPEDYVPLANAYPGVRLILAHLGFCHDGDCTHQVRAIQRSRHGNVYADTSSSMSIMPNLIEWAVREAGAERILFGSDTPVYFVANQRARIDYADIPLSAKRRILRDNAAQLLLSGKGRLP